ncbi:MAG: NUDIX domain-containing protein [Beijerinckiaceae bacterium]
MKPEIIETRTLFSGWTRLLSARIRLADGTVAVREIEDRGRSVSVLPYDADRAVILLVKLLRAPALFAEHATEVLEAPAGMIEEEDAGTAARRELLEETGVRVDVLERVGAAWTSPGLSTEKMDLFLAPYSSADRVREGGGAPGENENITIVEMGAEQAWAMLEAGEIDDLKTLTLLLFLRQRHPELFTAR